MEQGRIVILMGAHLKSKVKTIYTSLFIRNTDRTKKKKNDENYNKKNIKTSKS